MAGLTTKSISHVFLPDLAVPVSVHTALISQSIKFRYGRLGVHFPGVPAMEGARARSPGPQNFAWGILAGLLFLTDALHSLRESLLC